jgi:peroxiredoxin
MTDSDQMLEPVLQTGQIIPSFALPGSDGMPHSPWDYKQRENLLLLLVPEADDPENQHLLMSFGQNYPRFREERCSLLVITTQPVIANLQLQEKLHLPFPIVADVQAQVFSRYTRSLTKEAVNNTDAAEAFPSFFPGIVLTDRYNALYQQWIVRQPGALPTIDELLQTLQYMNSICTP